jgi:hypothetical protein
MEHIASQLEAMAAGVVLSSDAAAQIRAALRGAYEALGRLDPDKRGLRAMAGWSRIALLKAAPARESL